MQFIETPLGCDVEFAKRVIYGSLEVGGSSQIAEGIIVTDDFAIVFDQLIYRTVEDFTLSTQQITEAMKPDCKVRTLDPRYFSPCLSNLNLVFVAIERALVRIDGKETEVFVNPLPVPTLEIIDSICNDVAT